MKLHCRSKSTVCNSDQRALVNGPTSATMDRSMVNKAKTYWQLLERIDSKNESGNIGGNNSVSLNDWK